jgi:putative PIN family toxin of toxin-antitoxin system
MRLVLDTSVLTAALRSKAGASNRLVDAALRRRFTMLASVPLFVEYEAVLTRSEHLKAASLTAAEARTVLDAIASVVEPVRLSFLWRPQLRDANDDMVLETAINGRAEALVTFNRTDFAGSDRFGIRILSPAEALREIGEIP